jgi:hypothetical protein
LAIAPAWCDSILDGHKIWEIRGTPTKKREVIALNPNGTHLLTGECRIVSCHRISTLQEFQDTVDQHQVHATTLPYPRTFAWVLAHPKRYTRSQCVRINKPKGAQIFCSLTTPGVIPVDQ